MAEFGFEGAGEEVEAFAVAVFLAEVDELYGGQGQVVDASGKADA